MSDTILSPQFHDDDLVYVDPDTRTVIGIVEWNGEKPVSKVYVPIKKEDEKPGKSNAEDRPFFRKFFPFGTYRTMKKIYKIEGKVKEAEPNRTFEEVLPKALNEAFWTWEEKKIEQDKGASSVSM